MRIVDSLHRRPISAFIHNERNWSIEQAVDTLGRIGYDGIDYGPIGAERSGSNSMENSTALHGEFLGPSDGPSDLVQLFFHHGS